MRIATPNPRPAAALRTGLRLGWSEPVRAEVLADFGKHGSERQLAELRPWGSGGDVDVSCCSIGGHHDTQTLPRDPDPQMPASQQAVQLLATFFFGGAGLVPRIIGPVEWRAASMTLRYSDDDDPANALLRLHIKPVDAGSQRAAMASCRQEQDGAHKAFLLYLRPADADPLHALLRVALGMEVDHGFTA
jgi:hypothetical protein